MVAQVSKQEPSDVVERVHPTVLEGPSATPANLPDLSKFKIPPVWVPSDDCEVFVGQVIEDGEITEPGIGYRVHEGESIAVLPVRTMTAFINIVGFISTAQEAPEDVSKAAGWTKVVDEKLDEVCAALSLYCVAWNWTGIDGQPLPQPYKNPASLKGLETDELMYIIKLVQQNNPEARKNGSGPLATTSGAKGQTPEPA